MDIVLGGLGDDQLNGSDGENLLLGGDGADRLFGGRKSDVLIGGRLDETGGPLNLPRLLAAWRNARSASAKLAAVQSLVDRVLDDASPDALTGRRGTDLFVSDPLDQITDLSPSDLVA
jgi:Ca2+-binding RTX toxin-like protein